MLRGSAVEREQLAAELWPECDGETSRANLRRHVHALERAFASLGCDSAIVRNSTSIQLAPAVRGAIDVARYVDELATGNVSTESISAYAEPVAGGSDEWLDLARERLRREHAAVLTAKFEAALRRARAEEIAASAHQLFDLDLLQEPALRRAMIALADLGSHARAHQVYESYARRLQTDLGAKPEPQTIELLRELEAAGRPKTSTLPIELTPFLGRERETDAAEALIANARIVNLTGPVGVGKSRIALRAAANAATHFSDGVRYVDVSLYHDDSSLKTAFADVLRASSLRTDAIANAVAAQRLLVVFDNCDRHVGTIAELAASIVNASRGSAVLATSRTPTHAEGERVLAIEPLTKDRSVSFFLERAAAAGAPPLRGGQHLAAVEAICGELDGLPLALEFAAAQLPALGIVSLRALVSDRFAILRSRRNASRTEHQITLEGAYDWSYEQLDTRERELFRRMGLIRGAWDLSAIAAYCSATPPSIAATLARLTELSLVRVDVEKSRFTTLRSTRDYMRQRLEREGELETAERAYLRVVLQPIAAANDALRGARAFERFADIERRFDDVRAALESAIVKTRDVELGVRALNALSRFVFEHGHVVEALAWYDDAIVKLTEASPLRAETVYLRALVGRNQAGFTATLHAFEDAIAQLRAAGDGPTVAKALLYASNAARMAGECDTAARYASEASDLLAASGDRYMRAFAATARGAAAYAGGALAEAANHFEGALETFSDLDAHGDAALMLVNIGRCHAVDGAIGDTPPAYFEGGLERGLVSRNQYAEAHARVSLALAGLDRNDLTGVQGHLARAAGIALGGFDVELTLIVAEAAAEYAVAIGDVHGAGTLLGAADAARTKLSAVRAPTEAARYGRARRATSAAGASLRHRDGPVELTTLLAEFARSERGLVAVPSRNS